MGAREGTDDGAREGEAALYGSEAVREGEREGVAVIWSADGELVALVGGTDGEVVVLVCAWGECDGDVDVLEGVVGTVGDKVVLALECGERDGDVVVAFNGEGGIEGEKGARACGDTDGSLETGTAVSYSTTERGALVHSYCRLVSRASRYARARTTNSEPRRQALPSRTRQPCSAPPTAPATAAAVMTTATAAAVMTTATRWARRTRTRLRATRSRATASPAAAGARLGRATSWKSLRLATATR